MFKKTKKAIKTKIKLIKLVFIYLKNSSFSNSNSKKEIIIIFDGNISHGGLVDRLKGIISFYELAKQCGADFKIYFKSPFDLEVFLIPNQYNWIATANDLKWNPFSTSFLLLMDNFNFDWNKNILQAKKKKIIVYANVDFLPKIYNENAAHKWKELFTELFKRTPFLEEQILNTKLPNRFISIHTRFTSILGDFQDTTNRVVSETRKNEIILKLINEIDCIKNENNNLPIVVFSDSIIFLNFVRNNTSHIVLNGNPTHIDVKNDATITSNIKTFIDFFAISNSEKVYLLHTSEMYKSSFSKYAALVSQTIFKEKAI